MNHFNNLSERLMAKVMSYLHLKEGTERLSSVCDPVSSVITTRVKDSLGYMYEIQITPIGRTKLDREELK